MGVLDSPGWKLGMGLVWVISLSSCVYGLALSPYKRGTGQSFEKSRWADTETECDIPKCFDDFQSDVSKGLAEDGTGTSTTCRTAADSLRQCIYSANGICGCTDLQLQVAADFLYNEEEYLLHNCFGTVNNTCKDERVQECIRLVDQLLENLNNGDPQTTWVAVNEAVECEEGLRNDMVPLDGCGMYPWLLVSVPRFNEWKWMMDLQGCPVFEEFADHDECKLADVEAHFITTGGLRKHLKGYIDCLMTSYEGVEECIGLEGYRVTMVRFVEFLRVKDCEQQKLLKSFLLESGCVEPEYNEAQEKNCLVEGFGSDLDELKNEMVDDSSEKEANGLEVLGAVEEQLTADNKETTRDISSLLERLKKILSKEFF